MWFVYELAANHWTFLFLHHKVDVCYCWRATVLVQHLYYCHTFQNIVFMKFEMFKHWKDTNNEMMEYWFSEETFLSSQTIHISVCSRKKEKGKTKTCIKLCSIHTGDFSTAKFPTKYSPSALAKSPLADNSFKNEIRVHSTRTRVKFVPLSLKKSETDTTRTRV